MKRLMYEIIDNRRTPTLKKRSAHLFSSRTEDGTHSPVLDIDFPARLVPSGTPGHFHLYLDGLEIPWGKYRNLIKALSKAGVIQEGYARASYSRKATMVRTPWAKKGVGPDLNNLYWVDD